jgi:hypothetical protein
VSNPSAATDDQHAQRRAIAARRSRATVARLQAGIERLEADGREVSAHTVREVTGLAYKTIHRNPVALDLFRAHSTALRPQGAAGAVGATDAAAGDAARPAQDPLSKYSRQRLQDLIRTLRKRVEVLGRRVGALERRLAAQPEREAQHDALLQEHATCALTIERLEARVRELQGMEVIVKNLRGHLTRQEFDV